MPDTEHIIYKGEAFTIVWYATARGRSPALDYFKTLSRQQQDRFLILIRAMGDIGKIFNKTKFNYEGDGIYAFKPQPDRFLCFFFTGKKIIVTNGFRKKRRSCLQQKRQKRCARNRIMKRGEDKMPEKTLSTYDELMQDPERRQNFEKEYREFVLSELVLALMENDSKSVRKLAKEANLSPTAIQNIRSGRQKDIRLTKFRNIVQAFGYRLVLEKDGERIPIG